MAADRLLILDASSYFYRAYYAMPELTSPQGKLTGAIYGTLHMFRSLRKRFPSRYVAVVFDSSGVKFRQQLYPAYKANRPAMPEAMLWQLAPTKAIITALGFTLLEWPQAEADDLIARLAQLVTSQYQLEVIIATSDKDLMQLVNTQITLVDTMKQKQYDPQAVERTFGVQPSQIADFLMLLGDAADNVPGVPGVGKITAAKLLQRFGSVDNLLAHLDQLSPKLAAKLGAASQQLALTRQLIVLPSALDFVGYPFFDHFSLSSLEPRERDSGQLRMLYRQLGFQRWLKELSDTSDPTTAGATSHSRPTAAVTAFTVHDLIPANNGNYEVIDDQLTQQQRQLLIQLQASRECQLLLISHANNDVISDELQLFFYCQGRDIYQLFFNPNNDTHVVARQLAYLQQLWQLPGVHYFTYQVKELWKIILRYQLTFAGYWHDVKLAAYLVDNTRGSYPLDELLARYLELDSAHNTNYSDASDASSKWVKITATLPHLKTLHQALWNQLASWPAAQQLLQQIDLPLAQVLARMELVGVRVDANELTSYAQQLAEQINQLQQQIYVAVDASANSLNLNSPKQLAELLYDKLQLPRLKKTTGGQVSTSQAVLQKLVGRHPVVQLLLMYRELTKLKNTYLDPLPQLIQPASGRVHTHYHQTTVLTGRLSSSQPNLQNIPIWGEAGGAIRHAFTASSIHAAKASDHRSNATAQALLLTIDYSQIELRVMAHLSGDPTLISAFQSGADIHCQTAATLFNLPLTQISKRERRIAKTVNFGIMYGMSPFGLAERLDIPRVEAAQYIQQYFTNFPRVKTYIEQVLAQARTQGYVTTILNRKLIIPNLHAAKPQLRQAAERLAVNATVQGSAAELIKLAMLAIDRWIQADRERQQEIAMLMQVHDELIFELPACKVERYGIQIKQLMEGVYQLQVPLIATLGWGTTWAAGSEKNDLHQMTLTAHV